MDYAVGIALALVVAGCAALVGFDRDRAFYPTLLVVIASYYVLFAVIGGSVFAVLVESAVMTAFAALAVLGFRGKLWIVAAALAGHGVFDAVHGSLVTNPGVPVWWPARTPSSGSRRQSRSSAQSATGRRDDGCASRTRGSSREW
jgi:hypothetical protein